MCAEETVKLDGSVSGPRGETWSDVMGIEYMIDHPCRPKEEMGEEHLKNLLKMAREKKPEKTVGWVESA